MTVVEFLKEVEHIDFGFTKVLAKLDQKAPDIVVSIDTQIIWYCRRQISNAYKVAPMSFELTAHIARCMLELETILRWLKQDDSNYKVFQADAEFANLNLMKSKKEAIAAWAPEYTSKFENSIVEIQKSITDNGHDQNKEKLSALHNVKSTASKLDPKNGKLVVAKFDFYSKMSHPTAWLITMDPNTGEDEKVRSEAMAEIKNSSIHIMNRIFDSHWPEKNDQ